MQSSSRCGIDSPCSDLCRAAKRREEHGSAAPEPRLQAGPGLCSVQFAPTSQRVTSSGTWQEIREDAQGRAASSHDFRHLCAVHHGPQPAIRRTSARLPQGIYSVCLFLIFSLSLCAYASKSYIAAAFKDSSHRDKSHWFESTHYFLCVDEWSVTHPPTLLSYFQRFSVRAPMRTCRRWCWTACGRPGAATTSFPLSFSWASCSLTLPVPETTVQSQQLICKLFWLSSLDIASIRCTNTLGQRILFECYKELEIARSKILEQVEVPPFLSVRFLCRW